MDYTKEDVRMADEYIKVINTRSDGINKEVPRHEMARVKNTRVRFRQDLSGLFEYIVCWQYSNVQCALIHFLCLHCLFF